MIIMVRFFMGYDSTHFVLVIICEELTQNPMQQSNKGRMYYMKGVPSVCQRDYTFSDNDRHRLKLVSYAKDIEASRRY